MDCFVCNFISIILLSFHIPVLNKMSRWYLHNIESREKQNLIAGQYHDNVIKWKHFPRYWPFVRGIHRSMVNSPHKGQWRGPLMFSLICARINGWVNNREAGDLRLNRAHYDIIVMMLSTMCLLHIASSPNHICQFVHSHVSVMQIRSMSCATNHITFSHRWFGIII